MVTEICTGCKQGHVTCFWQSDLSAKVLNFYDTDKQF